MRAKRAAAAAISALLLAGCTAPDGPDPAPSRSSTAPEDPVASAARARAAEVVRAWEHSAARLAWRTGYYPLDPNPEWLPAGAFRSLHEKAGYLSGSFALPARLPGGEPAAEVRWGDGSALGLPLRSVRESLLDLAGNRQAGPCHGDCTPLPVGEVRAGRREVGTSRGQATVPVWEFTVEGYAEPFALPAVGAQDRARPLPPAGWPGSPAGLSVGSFGARTAGDDGLTLTGTVDLGPCRRVVLSETYETEDSVVPFVLLATDPGGDCAGERVSGAATVHLRGPLGGRTVLDLETGEPRRVGAVG
ncbi:hypothetical protein ACIRBX_19750 [Kitasatospora sp. NPDC096147]|uniref:hypothetical protein n=1 Tax=Kitasatospora sp. NPDC096147 TaxID=3364093 RepID=UPI00380F6DD6